MLEHHDLPLHTVPSAEIVMRVPTVGNRDENNPRIGTIGIVQDQNVFGIIDNLTLLFASSGSMEKLTDM